MRRQNTLRGARPTGTRGVTVVEMMVAMAVLLGFSTVALVGFTQFNRFAAASRLQAQALILTQQGVEQIMTTSWQTGAPRPALLATGAKTESDLTLNTDATNQQSGLSSAFTSEAGQVRATRTTTITDVGTRAVSVLVTVSFTYRNRPYTTWLRTMRVTDNI